MRNTMLFFSVAVNLSMSAQRALHFTATSGYDHGTRDVSFALFTSIGAEIGIDVVNDPLGTTFSDASALAEFDAIIFSNTSGNNILDVLQRANFEQWVNAGGHVLGIHAASDTYRHSTANGTNTGAWDFYAELIGASVQENPNHVAGTPEYAMSHIGPHSSTADLPDPWVKNEEYYYWEGGYYGLDNVEVLRVEETVGPNGLVNSYDAERPMSWYRILPEGNRIFYTALGHAQQNYTEDLLFREHITDALTWLLDGTTGLGPAHLAGFNVLQHPYADLLRVEVPSSDHKGDLLRILDTTGRMVLSERITVPSTMVDISSLVTGHYLIQLNEGPGLRIVLIR